MINVNLHATRPIVLRNRQTRQCCVAGCQHQPLKGLKLCRQHLHRRAVLTVRPIAIVHGGVA